MIFTKNHGVTLPLAIYREKRKIHLAEYEKKSGFLNWWPGTFSKCGIRI
jgi:hypothetical protein